MKSKHVLSGLLFLMLIFSCQEENDSFENIVYQNDAKLKRILLFAALDSEEPINVVAEYEYDMEDRISRISRPSYQDGEIVGIINYDLYEYNTQGKLIRIKNFNSNSNSPTGFINLKNYIYTYSGSGNREREYIEYPQIGSSEYSLYVYNEGKLSRIERYGNSDNLESYTICEYDNSGNLSRETSYGEDNQPFSYTKHSYKNGLNVQSDIFSGGDINLHIREIFRTYDENKNLIILESNELSPYSSMLSHVLRYEYF